MQVRHMRVIRVQTDSEDRAEHRQMKQQPGQTDRSQQIFTVLCQEVFEKVPMDKNIISNIFLFAWIHFIYLVAN